MEILRNSGVYAIKSLVSEEMYIGSSTNLVLRKGKHKSLLKHNRHLNHKLQECANKYGYERFQFLILEYCTKNLIQREQYYIRLFNPALNIITEIVKLEIPESTKKLMSEAKLRQFREGLQVNCAEEIVCVNIKSGEVQRYSSIKKAAIGLGFDRSSVQRVLYGIYKQNKGWKFYYKLQYEDLVKSGELLETPEVDNQQPSIPGMI